MNSSSQSLNAKIVQHSTNSWYLGLAFLSSKSLVGVRQGKMYVFKFGEQ